MNMRRLMMAVVLVLVSGCASAPEPLTVPVTLNAEEVRIMWEEGGIFRIPVGRGVTIELSAEDEPSEGEAY